MRRPLRNAVDGACLVLLPAALVACAALHLPASGLLTLLAAIAAVAVFFAGWESSRPGLRQLVPAAVLSALAVAGRVLLAAVPNVQPVTAVCVIAGASFGRRAGFMVGAMTGLVSSFFLGVGAWTPWQMYAWGVVGYVAGVLFFGKAASGGSPAGKYAPARGAYVQRTPIAVLLYGFVASFAYGFLMNTWTLVGFVADASVGSALAVYGAGVAFDAAHAASTVAFLALLYVPWRRRLDHAVVKFGLSGQAS